MDHGGVGKRRPETLVRVRTSDASRAVRLKMHARGQASAQNIGRRAADTTVHLARPAHRPARWGRSWFRVSPSWPIGYGISHRSVRAPPYFTRPAAKWIRPRPKRSKVHVLITSRCALIKRRAVVLSKIRGSVLQQQAPWRLMRPVRLLAKILTNWPRNQYNNNINCVCVLSNVLQLLNTNRKFDSTPFYVFFFFRFLNLDNFSLLLQVN